MTGRTHLNRSAGRAAAFALAPVLALPLMLPAAAAPAAAAPAAPAAAPVPTVDRTIARGLDAPWGLAFLPDGSAFVSERDSAEIKLLDGVGGVAGVGTVPGVKHGGEGGLLGIAVAPDFDTKPHLYAYFTAEKDNRIVRMAYKAGKDGKAGTLGKPKILLDGIPNGVTHNGGRIAFGPDGMLYAGTGEAGMKKLAQQRGSLGGKILRLTRDGKVPADNPTRGSYVYSRGHRNVQGLAFDANGRLFAAEFGQNRWDELNLIRPGGNTGWPVVEGKAGDKRYDDPIAQWSPEAASPSGIAMVGSTIFMAGLRGERLWRITLGKPDARGVPTAKTKAYLNGKYGRLRHVALAPDGSLWLVTNNTDGRGVPRLGDDRVLRVGLT